MKKQQWIISWPGQTMFGPFNSIKAAEKWAKKKFGPNWFRGMVHIWALEKP